MSNDVSESLDQTQISDFCPLTTKVGSKTRCTTMRIIAEPVELEPTVPSSASLVEGNHGSIAVKLAVKQASRNRRLAYSLMKGTDLTL